MGPAVQRTFEEMGAPLFEVCFCVLDVETTGGSPAQDAITEIGALRVRGGEVEGTFQTLINPAREIPPFITVLTGITHAMVTEAPPLEAVLPSFLEFLGDSVVVGHNVSFDLRFLNAAASSLGYPTLRNRSVDTVGLARRLIRNEVRNLRLASLAAHFRSPVTPDHRAFSDAQATSWVFHGLLERAGTLGVTALEDLIALPTARGSAHYSKIRLTDPLPRAPGVYLFRDRDDVVFYVGKAKNLRARVRSYFYGDERRSVGNMLRRLARIEHRVCESEVEARVTELRLIHAHRPQLNRRSKPPRASHWLKLTDERFPRLSVVRTLRADDCLYLGPFRSRRRADLVMTAIWDALPIRRCTVIRKQPCAYGQLGVSACPCGGAVDEETYRGVVTQFREGIERNPALLLDPLARKMRQHAETERFEEAAQLRDRHRALARALEGRRAWQALSRAGMVRAQSATGEGIVVDGCRLVAAWRDGRRPLLYEALRPRGSPSTQVASGVLEAEEARILWSWLSQEGIRLLECEGGLDLPAHQIPALT